MQTEEIVTKNCSKNHPFIFWQTSLTRQQNKNPHIILAWSAAVAVDVVKGELQCMAVIKGQLIRRSTCHYSSVFKTVCLVA